MTDRVGADGGIGLEGDLRAFFQDDTALGGEAELFTTTLDDALKRLEALSPRQARVVECLFFAGFTVAETAEAMETSPATVKRDWSAARAWLYRAMHSDSNSGPR